MKAPLKDLVRARFETRALSDEQLTRLREQLRDARPAPPPEAAAPSLL